MHTYVTVVRLIASAKPPEARTAVTHTSLFAGNANHTQHCARSRRTRWAILIESALPEAKRGVFCRAFAGRILREIQAEAQAANNYKR